MIQLTTPRHSEECAEFRIEITPEWAQKVALALPTGWTMDALHRLMNFQAGALSAVPHVVALATATLVVGWAAARTFRFD
ncbi:MAG TPA: hypothetical protein VMN39_09345 [Longimicrobiaceae bacterium]|nr:hypothetical protein [Longimicrobiaceae bacterium]